MQVAVRGGLDEVAALAGHHAEAVGDGAGRLCRQGAAAVCPSNTPEDLNEVQQNLPDYFGEALMKILNQKRN